MRIVVIEGTGGLADQPRGDRPIDDETAGGRPVGALVVEGDLTFVSIDAHASDLEQVLSRDLRMDETLREAWRQQRIISAAAREQRRDQNVAQLVALLLGLTVTALVVAQAVLHENGYLAENPLVERFFDVAILVLPIMVASLAAATGRWRPGTRWILLRASSEAIKREIWRYRARAGTYSHAKTRRVSREVKLAEAVGSSIGGLMRTDVSQLAFDPAPTSRSTATSSRRSRPTSTSRSGSTIRSTTTCGPRRSSSAGPGCCGRSPSHSGPSGRSSRRSACSSMSR